MIEIAGIFAVVASLIFVGLQLHLDRKVALADQYFNRAESAKADRRAYLDSDDYMQSMAGYWARGERPSWWDDSWDEAVLMEQGEISAREVEAQIIALELSIIGYDSVYFQYQQGLLDETLWINFRTNIKSNMARYDLTRAVFAQHARTTIRPVIEEILQEIQEERAVQPPSEPAKAAPVRAPEQP